MKVQLMDIDFGDAEQNPLAVYKSGQIVNFALHLILAEPVKCRCVQVKIRGTSSVSFRKGSGKSAECFESKEVYIDKLQRIFVPQADGPDAGCHPAGEHVYRLYFTLPDNAPSSYQDILHGWIRYHVTASIDRPWKIDSCVRKFFTVVHDLDLNEQPLRLVGPFQTDDEDDQQLYMDAYTCCHVCCCFECKKIEVRLQLERCGYVPGEEILIQGEIFNGSCTDIGMASVQLLQKAEYLAADRVKVSDRVAASIELPGILRGDRLQLSHRLMVPPVVTSFLTGCNNINMGYTLRFVAQKGCCDIAKLDGCQIVVGTVPLRSALSAASAPAPLSEAPPPSYAECVFGQVEILGDNDAEQGGSSSAPSHWAPSYPVYSA